METLQILNDLGLSRNESRVYLALLNLGTSNAGKICSHEIIKGTEVYKTIVHRANVYEALDRLIKKGLVSYLIKKNQKIYQAASPERLINIIEDRQSKIKDLKSNLESIMPQLQLSKQLSKKSTVEIYEGVRALSETAFNWLKHNDTIVTFGVSAIVPEVTKSFIEIFHKKRIAMKIKMLHLYNEDAKERIKYLNSLPYTEAKYMPEEFNTPVTTLITGPEIIIVNWEKPVTFIRIENENLAKHYKKYFNFIYNSKSAQK